MAYDFPSNPVDGQVYDKFMYSSTKQSWILIDSVESLAVRVANAELLAPVGSIHMFAGGQAPRGYLFCQGQAVSRSTYANLFSAFSTTYGTGDGSTTFNLPDLQGRIPVGKAASGTFATLNNKGGAETHALDVTQIPSHNHIQNSHNHTQNSHNHSQNAHSHSLGAWLASFVNYGQASAINGNATDYGSASTNNATATNQATTATNQATTATNQNTGSSTAHNNLQPYNTVNYIIKV